MNTLYDIVTGLKLKDYNWEFSLIKNNWMSQKQMTYKLYSEIYKLLKSSENKFKMEQSNFCEKTK